MCTTYVWVRLLACGPFSRRPVSSSQAEKLRRMVSRAGHFRILVLSSLAGFHLKHRIFRTSLVAPPVGQEATSVREFGKVSAIPAALFISPRSTYVVALVAFKAHTFRLPTTTSNDEWKATVVKFVSDQQFTCGAFCPDNAIGVNAQSEEWFATGDAKGVIRLWHGLDAAFQQLDQAATTLPMNGDDKSSNKIVYPDMEKRLPTTSLHWHAHAVSAIAFTPSGAQLLSVGEESVLVQWHLASGRREYVPRLGGRAIISLVVKTGGRGVEEEWWMTLADGAMIRVGASSGLVSSIGQGVRLGELGDIFDPVIRQTFASFEISNPLAFHRSTPSSIRHSTLSPPRSSTHKVSRPSLITPFNPPIHRPFGFFRPLRPRSRTFEPSISSGRARA